MKIQILMICVFITKAASHQTLCVPNLCGVKRDVIFVIDIIDVIVA